MKLSRLIGSYSRCSLSLTTSFGVGFLALTGTPGASADRVTNVIACDWESLRCHR